MADLFTLTMQPIRVQQPIGTGFQPLYLCVDVGAYDFLDVHFELLKLEGSNPTVTIELWTSATNDEDASFYSLHSFGARTSAPYYTKANITSKMQRWLRWKVTNLDASAGTPAATFWLRGLGRSYSRSF